MKPEVTVASLVQPYCPPPGYRDYPFIYVFDATQLISQSVSLQVDHVWANNAVLLAGNEDMFLARAIDLVGFNSLGPAVKSDNPGGYWLRDANQRQLSSNPRPVLFNNTTQFLKTSMVALAPEVGYPFGSQIGFDIYGGMSFQYNGNSAAYSATQSVRFGSILFRGVRRFRSAEPDPWTKYQDPSWIQEPYSYLESITMSIPKYKGGLVANGLNAPNQYTLVVDSWDFELNEIRVVGNTGVIGGGGGTIVDVASLMLYDSKKYQMMSAPVNLEAINSRNNSQVPGWPTQSGRGALCPPTIYPQGSEIYFQLWSELSSADAGTIPRTFNLEFRGRRWYQR